MFWHVLVLARQGFFQLGPEVSIVFSYDAFLFSAPYSGRRRLPECAVFTDVSGPPSSEGPRDGSRFSMSLDRVAA